LRRDASRSVTFAASDLAGVAIFVNFVGRQVLDTDEFVFSLGRRSPIAPHQASAAMRTRAAATALKQPRHDPKPQMAAAQGGVGCDGH
jgi:hypothetical protein